MDFQMQQANQPTTVLLQGEAYPKTQAPVPSLTPIWRSRRILVSAVMFFCFLSITCLEGSIASAIVEMRYSRTISYPNGTMNTEQDFNFSVEIIQKLLSHSVVASLLSVPVISMIKIFGGSISYAMYGTMCGITSLLHPIFFIYFDPDYVVILRWVLQFFKALSYISISEIFSQWFPTHERCRLISYSYTGIYFGRGISNPLFKYLSQMYGWQIIFYTAGATMIASSILCIIFVRNGPSQDRQVSPQELSYVPYRTNNNRRPKGCGLLKKIMLCRPFWALCVARFTYTWVINTGLVFPLYVFDLSIKRSHENEVPLIVSIFAPIFILPIIGTLMDLCKIITKTTMTRIHKFINSLVYILTAVLFVALAVAPDFEAFMVFIPCAIRVILPLVGLILQINTVSIAPNDSYLIAGLSSAFIYLGEFAFYIAIGKLMPNHSSSEWRMWFLSESVICVLALVTFLFSSSESQPWS